MIDFPANPTNGQVYSNWIYDSSISAWRNVNTDTGVAALNTMGLRNVVPTSVQVGSGSATVNANGTVSFSGATAISLNGVFTSAYRNYKIIVNINTISATSNLRLRLRNAGTDITTANHFQGGLVSRANGTGAFSIAAATDSGFYINYLLSGYPANSEVNVYAPEVNQITSVSAISNGVESSQISMVSIAGQQSAASVADGFTIFPATGNLAGTVQVYGYTN
jgi:hypothetical protein